MNDHPDSEGAAIALSNGRIYLLDYEIFLRGARLRAFATKDGTKLWETFLKVDGLDIPSQYASSAQLRTLKGDPIIYMKVSGGANTYIEHRDGATGKLISYKHLGSKPDKERDLHSLYSQIALMLHKKERHALSIHEFVKQLSQRYYSSTGISVLTQFARRAVEHLDGLPVYGTRYSMKLSLEKAGNGNDVILKALRVESEGKECLCQEETAAPQGLQDEII